MSTLDRSILSIIDPEIKLDPILLEDSESEEAKRITNPAVSEDFQTRLSAKAGSWMPIIQVNSILFSIDEIISLNLNLKNKIPTISIAIKDNSNKFSVGFPLDGDVISLYLRPPDTENQRSIRMDFDIIKISSGSKSKSYSFSGILKIPGMFKEQNKAYDFANSFDHIQEYCEDLNIGFASNVTSTSDSMTRIAAFESYESLINQTVLSAYKNDDSFFTWYIDPFYYLCLVDLNKQFSLEDKIEQANVSVAGAVSGVDGGEGAPENIKGSLLLTNEPSKEGLNIFIESYSLENNTGGIWMSEGYKRYSQFYEMEGNNSSYESVFVDPLTTEGAENEFILLKGKQGDDFYKNQVKYRWMGVQSSTRNQGNVHDNFLFAKLQNHQNLRETNKMVLKVDLAGMNFYVYKYMRIPVIIYQGGENKTNYKLLQERNQALGEDKENDPNGAEPFNKSITTRGKGDGDGELGFDDRDLIKNEFLSGYYVVAGINYTYSKPGPVKQTLTLIRREWPIPAKHKNQ